MRFHGHQKRCVIILSDKSSGSSALQKELLRSRYANTIRYTRHNENETLYWNKASAILGLPQVKVNYSELPFSRERAEADLRVFLKRNLPSWDNCEFTKEKIFEGWERLCEAYGPIFIEKSPHHLQYRSALELILEIMEVSHVKFFLIGLIRNPVDTLYSSWRRWGANPVKAQYDWLRAYNNLNLFKRRAGDRLMIIRYEDLVTDRTTFHDVCHFVGIRENLAYGCRLHGGSLQRWRQDKLFRIKLDERVKDMAIKYGYTEEQMQLHKSVGFWCIYGPVLGFLKSPRMHSFRKAAKKIIRTR